MIHRLELTLPTAAENVALDEALLLAAEQSAAPAEILRIWEPAAPMVVVGRSSVVATEINQAACRAEDVPVLRRSSGGASIVAAPGCLMYATVLSLQQCPALRAIDYAHRFVLEKLAGSFRQRGVEVRCEGTSDLVLGAQKISGNSMRLRQTHMLYHGTLLYDMSLELIGRYLHMPPRQPDYRGGRSHTEFVSNLPLSADEVRAAIVDAWQPQATLEDWPRKLTAKLLNEKYSSDAWNLMR